MAKPKSDVMSVAQKAKDNSPYVFQREKLSRNVKLHFCDIPWPERQQNIINTCLHKDTNIVMIDGLWGTGKTLLSVQAALKLLDKRDKIDQIIYVRNPVESTKNGKLGYRKGTEEEKIAPYAAPFIEKLRECLGNEKIIEKLVDDERVICKPLGYIQGCSWNCTIIIVDEASCMTKEDLFLAMSRMGTFSKMFIIGDSKQNYIGKSSGFADVFSALNNEESFEYGINCISLRNEKDILRSKFLRFLMRKIEPLR